MPIKSFSQSVKKITTVLERQVGETCVFLNLNNEAYYGLDEIGYQIYLKLLTADSIDSVCNALIDEYEISREELERDLTELINNLEIAGIIELHDSE